MERLELRGNFCLNSKRYNLHFLRFHHTAHKQKKLEIAMGKRARGSEEAPEETNKRTRAQKRSQGPDPVPRRNLRRRNQEKPGRPGPSSHRAVSVKMNYTPPFKPPPQQLEQGGRLRQRRRLNAPSIRLQSQQPEQEHEQGARPITEAPEATALPASSKVEPNDPELSDSDASTCYSQDAAVYDVGRGVEAVGTPQAKDIEYWGSVKGAAEFIRSRSGLRGNWTGVRPLGKGGNGIAGLWELRGKDGQVIKVSICTRQSLTMALMIAEANGSQRGNPQQD